MSSYGFKDAAEVVDLCSAVRHLSGDADTLVPSQLVHLGFAVFDGDWRIDVADRSTLQPLVRA